MSEITIENFKEQYSVIENALKSARFIAIDTEFSALVVNESNNYSMFDSPVDRYDKMRDTASKIIPVQIGVSAFSFDRDNYAYTAKVFTFYIFPRSFSTIETNFMCNSSSLQFLCNHKFDFNKFVYSGLPFLSRSQEQEIRTQLKNKSISQPRSSNQFDLENLTQEEKLNITKWFYKAKEGDVLELKDVLEKYQNNFDILYFFHVYLRNCFKKTLWTYEEDKVFKVRKVSEDTFVKLNAEFNLEEELITNLLGFTRIFRLLCECKKPIVGHNLLMDLLLMFNYFEDKIPKSYPEFKKLVSSLMPCIYDTKSLSFEVQLGIPYEKKWNDSSLLGLYSYFKDGKGRHLALQSPLIESENTISSYDHFHHAGWDSYCTGYIFIRIGHIFAQSREPLKKKFMSSELFKSIEHCCNQVNVIRCSISHINMSGIDPPSTRPPCLIVESIKDKPININQIVTLLGSCGFIEVKPYSSRGRKALIAVDNFGSAKKIMERFSDHKDFKIRYYKTIQHSSALRVIMLGGAIATGAIFAWIAHSSLKK